MIPADLKQENDTEQPSLELTVSREVSIIDIELDDGTKKHKKENTNIKIREKIRKKPRKKTKKIREKRKAYYALTIIALIFLVLALYFIRKEYESSREVLITRGLPKITSTQGTTSSMPMTTSTTTTTTSTTTTTTTTTTVTTTTTTTITTTTTSTTTTLPTFDSILVTTGDSDVLQTEIISDGQAYPCSLYEYNPYPFRLSSTTGGLLFNFYPVICGGSKIGSYIEPQPDCYSIAHHGISVSMKYDRQEAASIVIGDFNETLMVVGGDNGMGIAWDSSELITFHQDGFPLSIADGPDLPDRIGSHCFTKINEEMALLTGGHTGLQYSDKTMTFDIVSQVWTIEGSVLNTLRKYGACGAIKDSGSQDVLVVIVGGIDWSWLTLSSTEIWSLDSKKWTVSANLPMPVYHPAGIVRPDKSGFLVLGGETDSETRIRDIFQFSCFNKDCHWEKLDIELSEGRSKFTAMFVPNSMADNCI